MNAIERGVSALRRSLVAAAWNRILRRAGGEARLAERAAETLLDQPMHRFPFGVSQNPSRSARQHTRGYQLECPASRDSAAGGQPTPAAVRDLPGTSTAVTSWPMGTCAVASALLAFPRPVEASRNFELTVVMFGYQQIV
ncbi:MAG: hypothetical protein M3072_01220 [Candidatus Dormibacteraeota bacterium]|nr:hypothetical protein [Candidatus Dormibacteraeota bacterium]